MSSRTASLGWVAALSLAALPAGALQPDSTTLTSVARNLHVDAWRLAAPDQAATPWSVTKTTLHGGKQEGTDLITVDNGRLSFSVVPTTGMSLYRAQLGDIRLGWDSAVQEIVNPVYVDLNSNGGLGWLDGFNGWMPRGGIEWSGHPGLDGTRMLTLHGRLQTLPASEVSVEIRPGNNGAPDRISVVGVVNERSTFGANFQLHTEISTEVGSNRILVTDVVTNRSAQPREYQMLYHSDYGEPLLGSGSRFLAAAKEVRPLDGNAARNLISYPSYAGPVPGFVENVFGMVLYGDSADMTTVMLQNAARDKAVTLTFATRELPFFTLWKNTGAIGEAYVTGLEPGTSYPANRSIERKAGRVSQLAAGASQRFQIEFAILNDTRAVDAAAARIRAIQGNRPTTLNADTIKPCCLSVVP